jgi:hypothetical protein
MQLCTHRIHLSCWLTVKIGAKGNAHGNLVQVVITEQRKGENVVDVVSNTVYFFQKATSQVCFAVRPQQQVLRAHD